MVYRVARPRVLRYSNCFVPILKVADFNTSGPALTRPARSTDFVIFEQCGQLLQRELAERCPGQFIHYCEAGELVV